MKDIENLNRQVGIWIFYDHIWERWWSSSRLQELEE